MNKSFSILLSLLLLLTFRATGQDQDDLSKLEGFDKYIEKVMKDWDVPGMGVSIVRGKEVIFARGFGYRDMENKVPVTENTLFAIGSCTKAFTATSVCQLVDEGLIKLDDRVRNYLPDFKLSDEYASEHMTPRDLMSHRSGLPRHDGLWYGSSFSRKELFDRLQYLEPNAELRTKYQYQNLMFMTAGILVGKVSGRTWESNIQDKILDPLKMERTNFSVTVSQKDEDHALPYTKKDDKVIEVPFRNIDAIGPAGNINSSVSEMANWTITQLNKGKFGDEIIVSPAMIRQMHTPQMVMPGGIGHPTRFYNSYGMAWVISAYQGHLRINHGGGIDGFSALVTLYPSDSLGIVILTNLGGNPIPDIIANNIFDRLSGFDPVDWNKILLKQREQGEKAEDKKAEDEMRVKDTKPSHPLEDYTGKFEESAYGELSIELKDGGLVFKADLMELPMEHYHYDIFQTEHNVFGKFKIKFAYNTAGEIDQLSIPLEASVDDIIFTRVLEEKELSKEDMEYYTGNYLIAGTTIKVYISGENKLKMFVPGQPEYDLVMTKKHLFIVPTLEGYSVRFEPGKSAAKTMVLIQPNGTFRAERAD